MSKQNPQPTLREERIDKGFRGSTPPADRVTPPKTGGGVPDKPSSTGSSGK